LDRASRLLVGVWIPLLEIGGRAGAASLAALVIAGVGAVGAYALVRVAERA
jgi:hypothetical protein